LRDKTEQFLNGQLTLNDFTDGLKRFDEDIKDGEEVFEEEKEFLTHALRTDEEIAVIFAKISRNPGSFDEIARSVTEEGAAQFHKRWTVSVEGYGHASVAEHAIIHMAVENVPSLDGDWVTDNRLGSYTEFSARFKGRQGLGYFIPEQVSKDPRLLRRWHEVHQRLFATYEELMAKGLSYIETDEAKEKWPERKITSKTVADQFKDLMPASRLTSIGVTMNAREAENTIRKMFSSPYTSVRQLGALLKEQSLGVAPTLVRYAEANEYMTAARRGLAAIVKDQRYQGHIPPFEEEKDKLVDLIEADGNADNKFIAAALYNDPKVGSYRDTLSMLSGLDGGAKYQILYELLGRLGKWDVPIRALEMPGDYVVEFPGMTYGVWREYKRHRMQSYQIKDLDVRWGYMIPPLAREMDDSKDHQFHGCVDSIREALQKVEDLFAQVSKVDPYAAHYTVTRLHYRPAIAKFNVREAYHLIDLRTGPNAHPYIRRLMWPLFDQICKVQPMLMDYLRLRMAQKDRPDRNSPWSF
ncbi:hypothetical protein A2Z23_02065, partial [Candidatus Curtissbacteria bacterium RBG_16_39_7]